MHGHVRRVGDEAAFGIENRAGEIEPLLDVHGGGRVLQRRAHFFGDRHEEIGEDFEEHGIDESSLQERERWRASRRATEGAVSTRCARIVARRQPGSDDDRLMRLDRGGRGLDCSPEAIAST